jgi:hypothetical protein
MSSRMSVSRIAGFIRSSPQLLTTLAVDATQLFDQFRLVCKQSPKGVSVREAQFNLHLCTVRQVGIALQLYGTPAYHTA